MIINNKSRGGVFLSLNKRLGTIFVLVFLFLFNGVNAYSIEDNIRFKSITIEDGLSQTSVESIFQDSKGYMWFGTSDGLNRYDGDEFKIYRYKLNSNNSLTSNYVDAIIEDKEGYIWVGTSKGLNKLDTSNDKITKFISDENNSNSISHYNVWAMLEDRTGDIWVATEKGLNRYKRNSGIFIKYFNIPDNSNSLSQDFTTCLYEDAEGLIWIGTKNGLNSIDPKNDKITRYMVSGDFKNSINSNYITKITGDAEGRIWIGTKEGGLSVYNKKEDTIKRFIKDENNPYSIPSNNIKALLKDSHGTLWVGTEQGLCKYLESSNRFIRYYNTYNDKESLVNNDVLSIYEDKSGMIWVGTLKGISIFFSNPLFKHYKREVGGKNSLNDDIISGIYEDSEGLLWVGTYSAGLNYIDERNKEIRSFINNPKDKSSISNNSIGNITGDNEGNIWIATAQGLNKYDKKTKKFTTYLKGESGANSISSNEVKYVLEDSKGILWIATRDGLDSYDKKENLFKNYNDLLKANGLEGYFISTIYEDRQGILWLGSGLNGGLIKYNRSLNSIKIYKHYEQDNNSLTSNSIKSITEDSLGHLWIATNHGINKFDKNKESFTRYTEDQGLSNNYTYAILIDSLNNPWISTNAGICKFEVNSNKFISFGIADGLQSNEFNSNSYFKSKSGEMFFGGINGFNRFTPENIMSIDYSPKAVIKDFKIYDKSTVVKNFINLKHNENYFSLDFFIPDYKNPNKRQYAYMLEGVDKDWIYTTDKGHANYTNVDGGKYTFKVKGRNYNGTWSEPTILRIEINTPPWKTWWAYTTYIILVILAVFFIWNYVKILENLVRQRTIQLNNKLEENESLYNKLLRYEKQKNNYFVNLSHELRTPLNVILSALQLIDKFQKQEEVLEKEKLKKYTDIIKRNSNSLLKVINDLIDASKIETGHYKLNIKKIDIVFLVEEVALSMKDYIESNGLEFIFDTEEEELLLQCDPIEIERCVVNLISNAVKFTPEGGTIWINIYNKKDHVSISVKDSGIGIAEEDQVKIFSRFGQVDSIDSNKKQGSGIGLTLVKSLIEIHEGNISLKSKSGEGSEFIIELPIKDN